MAYKTARKRAGSGRLPGPLTPPALQMSRALDGSTSLATLMQAMRESNARFEILRPMLPGAMARHVKPGPIDENGWSLLIANAAIAAKLRHLAPRLEAALDDAGFTHRPIRLKIMGASSG
jgi:hypothetical protein